MLGLKFWFLIFESCLFLLCASLIIHLVFMAVDRLLLFKDWLRDEIHLTYLCFLCFIFMILFKINERRYFQCLLGFLTSSWIWFLAYCDSFSRKSLNFLAFFCQTLPMERAWYRGLWRELEINELLLICYYIRHIYWYFRWIRLRFLTQWLVFWRSLPYFFQNLYHFFTIYIPIFFFFLKLSRIEFDYWYVKFHYYTIISFVFCYYMIPNSIKLYFYNMKMDFRWWVRETWLEIFRSIKIYRRAPRQIYINTLIVIEQIDHFHLPDHILLFLKKDLPLIIFYIIFIFPYKVCLFSDRRPHLTRGLIWWVFFFCEASFEFVCYI